MQSKADLMKKLRKERAAEALKNGLVKLRIEMYVTPDKKQRVLNYVARLARKRDA